MEDEQITFLLTTIWKEDTFPVTDESRGNKGNDLTGPIAKRNVKIPISCPKAMGLGWGRVWKNGQPAQFKVKGIETSHHRYGFRRVCRFYPMGPGDRRDPGGGPGFFSLFASSSPSLFAHNGSLLLPGLLGCWKGGGDFGQEGQSEDRD